MSHLTLDGHDVEIASALSALQGEPPGGLIVMPDTFNIVHRRQIIELAARHRVPAIYPYSFAVREGGKTVGSGVIIEVGE